jgi:hypothetical protein
MMQSLSISNLRRGMVIAAAIGVGAVALPSRGFGQRPDSIPPREPIRSLATVPPDSLHPPITARRAFFYSFLVPGSAQSMLGRHKAAAAFIGMALFLLLVGLPTVTRRAGRPTTRSSSRTSTRPEIPP